MGVQIYRLLISSSCSGGLQVLCAEDIQDSWEMATHCVCRNVMSLIIIIIIICSMYAPLCKCVWVMGSQQKGKKIQVYAIACRGENKVLSHKAARDYVKMTICSKVSDGHYNFSENYLSVLPWAIVPRAAERILGGTVRISSISYAALLHPCTQERNHMG